MEKQQANWVHDDWRSELAFPSLTEDMIERIKPYGREQILPPGEVLYRCGDVDIGTFIVLEGGIDVTLPLADGRSKITGRHRKFNFTGEFNLLNSQGAVVQAETICRSRLLCVLRKDLQRLMSAEGDIANLIVQAAILRRIAILNETSSGITLIGRVDDAQTTQLRRFFVRSSYPYHLEEVPDTASIEDEHLPSVSLSDGRILIRPTIPELADELGITELPNPAIVYDVAVAGAGPAGLAAAVYAASEGLYTIVIESMAPGGQAGTSSKIENYLGFPTGIDGQELASRAQFQALKFGVHFAISRDIVTVETVNGLHHLTLVGGIQVTARAIVVATGAQYRKLAIRNHERYENRGLFYAATPMESQLCRDKDIIVVGGGNSAGQASIFLSAFARHVYHIVRSPSLEMSMSRYLISRIESSSRITLCKDCEIVSLEGEPTLDSVTWTNRKTGDRIQKQISKVFVMIGAEPNSGWLFGTVLLDNKGFILTGGRDGFEMTPYATTAPGIYAVGDVRAHSVKRVASAVGEGSVVISDVHRYLSGQRETGRIQSVSGKL